MSLDHKTISLESEIRKLKLELLRQELDDRMINLKILMEKQRRLNETASENLTNETSTDDVESKYFTGSVLFMNVIGDFEVWHFVLLTLVIWVFIIVIINYIRKCVQIQRAKNQRNISAKLKRTEKAKQVKDKVMINKQPDKSSFGCRGEGGFNLKNESNLKLYSPSVLSANDLTDRYVTIGPNIFDNPELFLPSRKEFFLYTIDEHQLQMKRTFTAKKKVRDLNCSAKLSKSDTNLAIIDFN